jgi:hypothetical protein
VIGAQTQKYCGIILSSIKNYTISLKKKVNGRAPPESENINNNKFFGE